MERKRRQLVMPTNDLAEAYDRALTLATQCHNGQAIPVDRAEPYGDSKKGTMVVFRREQVTRYQDRFKYGDTGGNEIPASHKLYLGEEATVCAGVLKIVWTLDIGGIAYGVVEYNRVGFTGPGNRILG